jgi:beta-mannosidase
MRWQPATGDRIMPLTWRMTVTEAGAIAHPESLDAAGLSWIGAPVPGTAASALEAAGHWQRSDALTLHDRDVWYVAESAETGSRRLVLAGLATLAEVYLGGELIFTSSDFFRRHDLDVTVQAGDRLAIAFRALAPALAAKGPRARWRVPMIPNQGLRHVRTTLFGHMPGWCPAIDAVGPTRAAMLVERGPVTAEDMRVSATMAGTTGVLAVSLAMVGAEAATLLCGGQRVEMQADGGRWTGRIELPDVRRWWPNGYGEAALYDVSVEAGGVAIDLGRVGFRTIERDAGDGFGLIVNGVRVFCRGACWTNADVAALPGTRKAYEPILRRAHQAGMTMIRVGGTMIPETRAFFDLCDELGILVWQEFSFANFDYPAADEVYRAEAMDMLAEIGAAPSLAVLCGGSENFQQAAMMGLPADRWPDQPFTTVLTEVAASVRPDVPYVANSPIGGALPFAVDRGVAHYYGVGAYRRPLEDARRAEVTFASECLAFANVPADGNLGGGPRDLGADWDFADVRDHYVGLLFGVDPARLREEDTALYLDLARVAPGAAMEAVFAEWRRGRSPTRGGLVWTLMDVAPGSGWGVLDHLGQPKAAWYALKRAFRPVQVTLTDEGVNGLAIHLINDTADTVEAVLTLTCLRDGRTPVLTRSRPVTLSPRSAEEMAAFDVIGAFFDLTYAYRFGPPGHDVTAVRLTGSDGRTIAEAFHHPLGLKQGFPDPAISAAVEIGPEGAVLVLQTDTYAPFVFVTGAGLTPADDGFALMPGVEKRVPLGGQNAVSGEVRTPGARVRVSFA